MVKFQSNLRQMIVLQRRAAASGVKSVAVTIQNQARLNARGGFKSGKFTTTGWNLIVHVMLTTTLSSPTAQIGSSRDHFLYWELGHHNLFTRQYERYEWLVPAFRTVMPQAQAIATREFQRVIAKGIAGRLSPGAGRLL